MLLCLRCLLDSDDEPGPSPASNPPYSPPTMTTADSSSAQQHASPAEAVAASWRHPLEALINLARDEPDCLAIYTHENSCTETFSYRQTWDRAYSIAQGLRTLPNWSEDDKVVALYCEPETHWVFYTYALWILGKQVIYFALNWPATVRNHLAQRLNIKYVLYGLSKPGRVHGSELIDARTFPLLETIPEPSLAVCAPLNDFIGFLSTSGTTGIPKTYPVAHKLGLSVRSAMDLPYIRQGVFQAPSFTAAMMTMLLTPNMKSSMWFPKPSPNIVEKAKGVVALLDDGMDFVKATPSFMRIVFKTAQSMREHVQWPEVKYVVLMAEMIPVPLVQLARDLCPNSIIHCGYGSSEAGIIQAFSMCTLHPTDPVPTKLVYVLRKPNVRCLLVDDQGDPVAPEPGSTGILCLAVPKEDPVRDHPNFVHSNPNDKLASFGFLEDGSPRVCTMDWVEMVGEKSFSVIGRVGRKVKVNGVYVDLQVLEDLLVSKMSGLISDCAIMQTLELKIVMLYVPKEGNGPRLLPRQILDMAETIFKFENISKVPINNCMELHEMPFNESGKRDLKKLKRIAERTDTYGLAVNYPPLLVEDSKESRIAAKVSRLGSEILEAEALDGRDYYIAGVGFDSLTVGRLALVLHREFDVDISPVVLLSHGMTPKNVAHIIIDMLDDRPFSPPTLDLAAEAAKLDDSTVTSAHLPPFEFQAAPRTILLTGATGFLGAFLLAELSRKFPSSKIICLIRGTDIAHATARLRETAEILLLETQLVDQSEVICGDLSKPQWGLSDEKWAELAERVDAIVHNGAEVHWLYNYERLMDVNVGGTQAALRLATTHHLKPLHYISTIGAIPKTKPADNFVLEKVYPDWNVSGGYAQTKWVSEQLIEKARSRGVPATIIRPSIIAGDSVHGGESDSAGRAHGHEQH
ncbi:male sterility protein-domain-containing protein [Polychytrium aggregatum]|uniref:male sterility protein-domain-containing protein n=1 Tax=Polychytrium aggregatum TaxID=110093 RepID=UPI0022FF05FB|nr:male sterility protein-domain-containing protein [Polychytrium aggregatum]KAI9203800.1 male sterility protein-domain-containing protein [Polychytrium aggregatum]